MESGLIRSRRAIPPREVELQQVAAIAFARMRERSDANTWEAFTSAPAYCVSDLAGNC